VSACTLVLGGHIVVMPRFDALEALHLVAAHGVTWMYAVPTMLSRIWRLPEQERCRHDLSTLRVVMHMAAPCPPWLKHAWIDWLGADKIWELYAATEVQAVTITTGDEWLQRPGTVGRPVVGQIRILDDDGRPVPAGTVGEIWMRRGEGVPNPYRYVGATARARDGGWESVGDLGRLDEDGYLYLSDRRSDLILVGGANVYPAEVEAALTEHRDVHSAVVVGVPHEDLGQVPHALIEVDREVADDDLRAHLADRLASYKIPRTFERVSGPLRDDAGKTRRSALAAERGATAAP
jgi:bile acid-coenzyme A ligase